MKKRDRTITIVFRAKEMRRIRKVAKREGVERAEYVYLRAVEASKYRKVVGFRP